MPQGETGSKRKSFPFPLVLIIAALLVLFALYAIRPGDLEKSCLLLLGQRLVLILFAFCIFLAAFLFGHGILRILKIVLRSPFENFLFSQGIGLGFVSVSVLVFGSHALYILGILFAVVIILHIPSTRGVVSAVREAFRVGFSSNERMAILASFLMFMFILLSVFLPPLDYDVTEYHLGAPHQYLQAGRVAYLPGNVYSNFPFNIEMLYFFSLILFKGSFAGVYVAKLVNLFLAVLTAFVTFKIGEKFFSRSAGILAAAIYITTPWIFVVSTKAYVTNGWTFYVTLALLAFLSYVRGEKQVKYLVLAGISAGIACGCKYPSVVYIVIPICIGLIINNLLSKSRLGKIARELVIFGAVSVLVFSPWMIKNMVYTGNPVYPLMYPVFGGKGWDELKDARWKKAHSPDSMSLKDISSAAVNLARPSKNRNVSILLILFIPLLVFSERNKRKFMFYLLGFSLCVFSIWLFFTHRIERFMVPAFPMLALLSAAGVNAIRFEKWRKPLCTIAVICVVVMCAHLTVVAQALSLRNMAKYKHRDSLVEIYEWPMQWRAYHNIKNPDSFYRENIYFYPVIEFARRNVNAEDKMLMIGEARIFHFPEHVDAWTVFSGLPLPDGPMDGYRWLKEHGYRYVFVNYAEVARFSRTYAFTHKGKSYSGFYEFEDPVHFFASLHAEGKVNAVLASTPEIEGAFPACVIYEIL